MLTDLAPRLSPVRSYKDSSAFSYAKLAMIASTLLLQLGRHAQAFHPQGFTARLSPVATALPFSSSNQLMDGPSRACRQLTTLKSSTTDEASDHSTEEQVPLYQSQGLFSVDKPLDWTSSDVVSYIRGILERDARQRGAQPVKVGSRRNKSRVVKVGHGGTLDPLATGVLVIGVGKGTKELQGYLSGAKRYRAGGELGFETTTLDMEGNVTKTAAVEHVTLQILEDALPHFTGTIMQVPPIFSAIRKGGKKLYQSAREGKTTDDIVIDAREVEIYRLELFNPDESKLPKFEIDIECGGGTYIRSLIRDIGYKVDSVATTTLLERTQQAQFFLQDALPKDEWNADSIYAAIDRVREKQEAEL